MRNAIVVILLLWSTGAAADTGDILYQNCTPASSCDPAPTSGKPNVWTRSAVSSGCYSGSCLKLVANILNPLPSGAVRYGAGNTSIPVNSISGKKEITVQYWLKLSKDGRSLSGANLKSIIVYDGSVRWPSYVIPHMYKDFYMNHVIGTIRPASWFSLVTTANNNDYSIDNGDGTFFSHKGYTRGTIDQLPRPGTTWTKFTHYMKLPSTPTGTNGIVKVWFNDQLMIDMYDCSMAQVGSGSFSYLTFYSSSEAGEPFEHWMDDMVVYEGYVPPDACIAGTACSSTDGCQTGTISCSTGQPVCGNLSDVPDGTACSAGRCLGGACQLADAGADTGPEPGPDTGLVDSGLMDAGSMDTGSRDAAELERADASASREPIADGCGCGAVPGGPPGLMPLLALLGASALGLRRARRRGGSGKTSF